ncbi:MAG: 4-hydroxy-tetrahydrodipicolinate synthase [Verrucomicrobia bacterium]|nr:4-hydroxy-tetrahydrodipicolinate synthase [Verrucomicrobiota bacterium]
MFSGAYTAIVTPFRNGKVDEKKLASLVESQIRAGIDGLVPVGTTGESPTLGYDEHTRVIQVVVKAAKGRCKVIAGTGSNCTDEAIMLTRQAEKAGADATLQVNPYYNKPTQEGLFRHFSAVAKATKLPVILYNIPGRTGVDCTAETVARLVEANKNIVGMKEASGSCDRVAQLKALCGDRLTVLSGDDSLTLPFMSVGAEGVISVASNIIPAEVALMVQAFLNDNVKVAAAIHAKYVALFKDLFIETNPIPVKTAMAMMGQIREEFRLPLCPMGDKNKAVLKATLQKVGLL